ncbi:LysR substrate-binding domain-containing protein [Pseudomonas segetis]|uniref:Transcriptional regulator, LysR family n=1 Tax=Pseudomonas segetis TaxID=298908 RepID=A0A239FM58_9PSED|nr:LysR substrate-binding domain-containing protein [Pseudomonas segetis]SNS57034.1 transcriptional regulator, LysR family [Pseudomonas segetis]
MNLFQLRAFDAVAREGSFTRAAIRLHISQPAVTGHIKMLEEHYQIKLLRRTAKRVELTHEGGQLATITRAMFSLVEEAQNLLEANQQLLTGRLEVAADGPHLVMPLIASLRALYPGVVVNLRLGNAQETLAALLCEHVDVAVMTDVEPRKELRLQAMCVSQICALVPIAHQWVGKRIGIEQLDQQIMVLREPDSVTRRTFNRACEHSGVKPRVLLELDSREAVSEAVAEDLGIGIVSSAEYSHDPRLGVVTIVGDGLTNQHMIGCLERRSQSRLVEAFMELANTKQGA